MADPGVPTPAALRPPVPVPASEPAPSAASDPSKFGRVEPDGTVILFAPEGEVTVGQWAAGDPSEGLAFFGRKYDDLVVEIDLIEKRLHDLFSEAGRLAIEIGKRKTVSKDDLEQAARLVK